MQKNEYPIVALISNDGREGCDIFTAKGLYVPSEQSHLDLFLSVPIIEQRTYKDGDVLLSSLGNPFIYNGKINKRGEYGCYCGININGDLVFDSDNWTSGVRGYAKESRQKPMDKLNESDNPLAKEYLERFFGADEIPNLSNSEKIGKDYKFEPFDKVLVRNSEEMKWKPRFFERFSETANGGRTITIDNTSWRFCIPFNEQTKHLSGTIDNWEE